MIHRENEKSPYLGFIYSGKCSMNKWASVAVESRSSRPATTYPSSRNKRPKKKYKKARVVMGELGPSHYFGTRSIFSMSDVEMYDLVTTTDVVVATLSDRETYSLIDRSIVNRPFIQ